MNYIFLSEAELAIMIRDSVRSVIREELSSLQLAGQANAEEYLSRKEVIAILGITLPTLNLYTKKGKIKAYRIGRRIRFKRSEVETSLRLIRTGLQPATDSHCVKEDGVKIRAKLNELME